MGRTMPGRKGSKRSPVRRRSRRERMRPQPLDVAKRELLERPGLAQIQFQNVFIPITRGADGYANTFIIQPVVPINLSSEIFPYHIIRPTLPLIEPADPDGPLELTGGVGDMTIAGVLVHPLEEIKTNVGPGYVMLAPTGTDRSVGLGEWHLRPAAFAVTTAAPNWVLGALVQAPISLESDAYEVQMQLIGTRLLENQWYVGWGDSVMKFDDHNGRYNIPLQLQVGKVVIVGKQPINVFLQGEYIPSEFQLGGGEEWGIKISITPLLPGLKIGPFFGH